MLTLFVGKGLERPKLVAQHLEFEPDARSILSWQQSGQFGLDLGLLIEESPNGRIRGKIGGDAHVLTMTKTIFVGCG